MTSPFDVATLDLFRDTSPGQHERLGAAACVLRGHALPWADTLLSAIERIAAVAPFRQLTTPGGGMMSVALTSCGSLGWTSDEYGYRYSRLNPDSGKPWPAMPEAFADLARSAAAAAGFADFTPNACLINRYRPGSRMGLHQDKNERDTQAPIVSVSLGMPAVFLFGGFKRSDPAARVPLYHGDVAVWGAADRMRYHGVMPLQDFPHARLQRQRLNLTFRWVA